MREREGRGGGGGGGGGGGRSEREREGRGGEEGGGGRSEREGREGRSRSGGGSVSSDFYCMFPSTLCRSRAMYSLASDPAFLALRLSNRYGCEVQKTNR